MTQLVVLGKKFVNYTYKYLPNPRIAFENSRTIY